MIGKLLDIFRSIPAPLVVLAALLLPAAETALLLGLLVPGELAVVAAGVYASAGGVPLAAVMAPAVVGAITGDSIGFLLGRRFRTTISHRLSAKRRQRAQEWLKRNGMPAIFLARFTPFLRSVMPPAAGAAKIPYRVFLLWSVPAGILWGTGSTLLGYYAARTSGAPPALGCWDRFPPPRRAPRPDLGVAKETPRASGREGPPRGDTSESGKREKRAGPIGWN